MEQELLIPFGNHAGETAGAAEVIRKFALEISLYMSMLGMVIHDSTDERDRELFMLEYKNLEKYVAIVFAIYYQMIPEAWEMHQHDGLITLAKEHELILPAWMTPKQA